MDACFGQIIRRLLTSRYGTRATGKPWVLMKADKIRSELPAAAATLSVSGLARANDEVAERFHVQDSGAESAGQWS